MHGNNALGKSTTQKSKTSSNHDTLNDYSTIPQDTQKAIYSLLPIDRRRTTTDAHSCESISSHGAIEGEELPRPGLGARDAPHGGDVAAGGAGPVGRREHHPVVVGAAARRRRPALQRPQVAHRYHVSHLVHGHRELAHLLDEVAAHILLLRVPRRRRRVGRHHHHGQGGDRQGNKEGLRSSNRRLLHD
uniref:Uncharacterized protein n=1 Tax=Zea mays TaxID=4577 RepID=A0A804PBB5_MAIZE